MLRGILKKHNRCSLSLPSPSITVPALTSTTLPSSSGVNAAPMLSLPSMNSTVLILPRVTLGCQSAVVLFPSSSRQPMRARTHASMHRFKQVCTCTPHRHAHAHTQNVRRKYVHVCTHAGIHTRTSIEFEVGIFSLEWAKTRLDRMEQFHFWLLCWILGVVYDLKLLAGAQVDFQQYFRVCRRQTLRVRSNQRVAWERPW